MLASIDSQMAEWKCDLSMMAEVVRISREPGCAIEQSVTRLKRDYQGLRIMRVVSWQAPDPKIEAAVARFEGLWGEWVDRATVVRREISG